MGIFNPHAAVKYAWANIGTGYRSPDWPVPSNGNDCTNFVSQCMYAAGWPMIYGGRDYFSKKYVTDMWWSDKKGQDGDMSWTWGAAPEFAKFMTSMGRGDELWKTQGFDWDKARKLQPGDILGQASSGSAGYGDMGHLCIVLEVFASPEKSLIGQHSGSKSPKPFSELAADTHHTWYAWRARRTFPDYKFDPAQP